jgi:sRNA-binding carbon storage regulator CsrA
LPKEGEELEIDGVQVTVLETSATGVRWIIARPRQVN